MMTWMLAYCSAMPSQSLRVFHDDAGCRLQVRIAIPDGACRHWPHVIWIPGGGWSRMGLKGMDRLLWLTEHGVAVCGIEYRTVRVAPYPALVRDVGAGLRFLDLHGHDLGLDRCRRIVTGDSAGGHLAALVALTGDDDRFRDERWAAGSIRVQGCAPVMGPSDLNGMTAAGREPLTDLVGGDPTRDAQAQAIALEASPVRHVHPDAPPFVIIHGRQDILVTVEHAQRLYEALSRHGVDRRLVTLPGIRHDSEQTYAHPQARAAILDLARRTLAVRPGSI